jgi:hypothetical protein
MTLRNPFKKVSLRRYKIGSLDLIYSHKISTNLANKKKEKIRLPLCMCTYVWASLFAKKLLCVSSNL